MPAYFTLEFELNKSKTAIRDFCTTLISAGTTFKSGYRGFESDSFDNIVKWNQNKLDENFVLGFSEHHSHDFKQMLLEYADFSEVRLYVMNYSESSTFVFNLIIPEDDFVEWVQSGKQYSSIRKIEKMDLIKNLAKSIWRKTDVLAIQTAWECSDCPPKAKQISSKIMPQTEPFCIIKDSPVVEKFGFPFEKIEPDGVLIQDINNWRYF